MVRKKREMDTDRYTDEKINRQTDSQKRRKRHKQGKNRNENKRKKM